MTDQAILTISVAAKLLGLHTRTLMLYEKVGLITPHRTTTNRRLYSISNLNELQFIQYLTQTEGINLRGVKWILEVFQVAKKEGLSLKQRLFPSFKLKSLL